MDNSYDNNVPVRHIRPAPPVDGQIFAQPLAATHSAQGQQEEIPLREYWRVIFKYRAVIAASVCLCVLIALVRAFTATPLYTAAVKLRIGSYEPILTATKIEDLLQQKSKETNYLETQIEELKSFSLADRVLQNPEVRQALFGGKGASEGFFARLFWGESGKKQGDSPQDETGAGSSYQSGVREITDYLDSIGIKPVRRTALVVVEATSREPRLSALIANTHASEYIEWVRRGRVEQQSRGLKFLTEQAQSLREKVADLERERADYAEANSIVAVNKDENITAQKMSQLNQLLTQATAKRIETEHLYKEANEQLGNPSAGFDDPTIQQMRGDLARLEGEYNQLSAKFTSSYPRLQQLGAQISSLRKSIERQRSQVVTGLKAKAEAALQEEKNLQEELEKQKSQAFELSKKQVQYNVLNREYTSAQEMLQNVLRQIKETSLAVESNASNVSIVDEATIPVRPSYPHKRKMVAMGLLLGLALGVGIAFLLSYLDNTVRTPDHVSSTLRLPCLGVIPSFEMDGQQAQAPSPQASLRSVLVPKSRELIRVESEAGNTPIVYMNAPKSLAAEAYRTIRTAILLSQAGHPPRSIMVSSAQSSEGKTTTTVNLAASLASAGARVCLIDADLRRPSLYRRFGLDRKMPGLVDLITCQATIEEVIREDLMKRVAFLPGGRLPPNPAELLGSLEMAGLIEKLSSMYDYVLIDSPPILPVADSIILSRYVDGVVLVVKGGLTPRKVIQDARSRLEAVGARVLGVVLNDVDITGGDYYYYNRYYYSYYKHDGEEGPGESTSVSGGQSQTPPRSEAL